MANYTCLLLDVDNTLLDFNAAERAAVGITLGHYGMPDGPEALETYHQINRQLWDSLAKGELNRSKLFADLMPGALTALEELGEVATLAIVSNGAAQVQESRIAASGIGRFMDGVYISEKVGAAKPSPKLLDYAIRDLGLTNRSRVLMVGDDLLADIKGGINAGIDTCWVNFANEENKTGIQPKYTVHSYEELYRVVMEPEELENVGVRNRRHMNEG